MPIRPRVSPRIVRDIANNYQSTSRILMEYVDNSLDSAETLFDGSKNQYSRPIHIEVKIDPLLKKVSFLDNCLGMNEENLLRIARDIGSSNKKADFSTNGQFGFGIHAYAACANRITITTLPDNEAQAFRLVIDRSAYDDEGEIDDIQTVDSSALRGRGRGGTEVVVSDFDSDWWKQVDPQILKREIEEHFEQLLYRGNLEVKILYNEEEETCSGFNYDGILGKVVEKTVTTLSSTNSRGVRTSVTLDAPLKIYLKVTDDIMPNKRPIFINKGRRVEEIQFIPSFKRKSKRKTEVWGHDNLIGFIEVQGLLEPKITRDDFIRSGKRELVYEQILEVEDEVYRYLMEINKKVESSNLGRLESYISSVLSKLARQENMRFRTEYSSGTDVPLAKSPGSEASLTTATGEGNGGGEGTGKGHGGGGGGSTSGNDGELDKLPVAETLDDTELGGTTKKTSGMNIKISNSAPTREDGTKLRSQFLEGLGIVIYSDHPDFEARVRRTRHGEMRITERLVSYIASEISIHFKDRFYEIKKMQPEIQNILSQRKDLLEDLTNFIYSFEEVLQKLVNKNLQTLESLED